MSQKKFYLETVGCQMNVLDSELVVAELLHRGFEQVFRNKDADIILFNTCSVRSHAEEKIYSALGRLKHWKEYKPEGILGVMGCMAQKDQRLIFRRAPHVDLVIGPGQLDKLPELIARIEISREPQMAVSLDRFHGRHHAAEVKESFRQYDPIRNPLARSSNSQAMVRIMFGCNKFCSYCIVPGVRGPEQSRPAQDIVAEVRKLADQGCVDLTLIGQTVNSYRFQEGERLVLLPELLQRIDAISGIRRVRFVSNYPTGMTDELLQAVRDLPSVMPSIHVPAQHGANRMLQRMKRMYTVEEYKELVDRIYATIPDVAITSDFIVGFSGETEADFQETVDLVRYARFKNSFIFKYSVREGTKASETYEDDVPEDVKKRRNNELLAVQNEISIEQNRQMIGKTVEIFVEGPSKSYEKERLHELQRQESSDQGALLSRSEEVFDNRNDRSSEFADEERLLSNENSSSSTGNCSSSIGDRSFSSEDRSLSSDNGTWAPEENGREEAKRLGAVALNDLKLPILPQSQGSAILNDALFPTDESNGKSDCNAIQLTGRTPDDRIVVFQGMPQQIGKFQKIKICDSAPFTLFGESVVDDA